MENKNKKVQQPRKINVKRIITPHLIALGILVGMVVFNYIALSNTHGGLDNIGVALGYVIIIRFCELLILVDIVWLILRLLSAKPINRVRDGANKSEANNSQKTDANYPLKIIVYIVILCISAYYFYRSAAGFLQAWNAYHSLNDLVALVSLASAVLFGGLVGLTCYNIVKLIKNNKSN